MTNRERGREKNQYFYFLKEKRFFFCLLVAQTFPPPTYHHFPSWQPKQFTYHMTKYQNHSTEKWKSKQTLALKMTSFTLLGRTVKKKRNKPNTKETREGCVEKRFCCGDFTLLANVSGKQPTSSSNIAIMAMEIELTKQKVSVFVWQLGPKRRVRAVEGGRVCIVICWNVSLSIVCLKRETCVDLSLANVSKCVVVCHQPHIGNKRFLVSG